MLPERIASTEKFSKITDLSVTTNCGPMHNYNHSTLRFITDALEVIHISLYGLDETEHRNMTGRILRLG
jgi:hypothetical protein